jgi:hypothetical protein
MTMSELDKNSETTNLGKQTEELRKLFQKTQALPQAKTISDEMIAEEIEKTRNK